MYVNISLSYKYLFPLKCHLQKYFSKKEKNRLIFTSTILSTSCVSWITRTVMRINGVITIKKDYCTRFMTFQKKLIEEILTNDKQSWTFYEQSET